MAKENRDIDVPIFDINDTGRVDLTLYKLDTGFMLRDNDLKKDHSVKMDDLDASLDLLVESIKGKLKTLMNDKQKFDFVDIAFIVQEGEDVGDQYELDPPDSPQNLDLSTEQLAEIVNEILSDRPMHDAPRRVGHRSVHMVTGNDILRAINSPRNMVRLKTRVKENSDPTSNVRDRDSKKRFFPAPDKTKNKGIEDIKNKHEEKDKNDPNKIS